MNMPRDLPCQDEEALLLARYASGDAEAARLLTALLLPRLLAFASRMCGGDRAEAEDIAQEAMFRLWRAAPGWREGEARVSTWAYQVVSNLATDRYRSRKRRERHTGGTPLELTDAPDAADPGPGAEAQLIAAQRMAALDRALNDLPPRQREAVVLRHLEGFSNPEIAAVMNVGVEAVESLTARGRRALAAALAGQRALLGFEGE
ncbi:RNA polymerase sigma factor [Xinfangfangia sp. D13-10-4-6]|uniref:RNA polymerase sigma factor n=1 Tax=Pseudogemmobacter hezensis TaxID=2737662 RepID=UPI00155606DA|nr:RNA polymerase sigma factor [Pseudogemmobacter hezensis]NPD15692.1 RNA polymerase sigma factor [Pseudogemmobacter hezensis]